MEENQEKKPSVPNYSKKPSRLKNQEIMRPYPREIWKEYKYDPGEGTTLNRRYAFSNFGRFGSFFEGIEKDLYLASETIALGYVVTRIWYRRFNPETGRNDRCNRSIALHKALAELFIPKPSPEHIFVIHKDYDKKNNELENLVWVTKEQLTDHAQKNPALIATMTKTTGRGMKLTEGQVIIIKKLLAEKKTRQRMIAQRFGISTTLLEQIKSGKKWSHVMI